jgi:hypothetical protein
MESKTPKIDALLDEILENLVPHERTCKWKGKHPHCEGKFNIESEDISFLKMLRVPAPNFCPTCRRMRRLVHMNFSRIFKRSCDVPGHNESVISTFPEECPFPVYDYSYFISDKFDSFSFGVICENETNPLETLFDLRKKFPIPSFLNRDPSSINSDYSSGGRNNKNCYYAMACYSAEDVWYSVMINKSRNVMDSRIIKDSEFVYRSFYSNHIYKSSFIYFSKNCTDSMFLFDCRNCDNCFGCVNLRGAKYRVWNEQLSKEDYETFIKSIYPLSRDAIDGYKEKFWTLVKTVPINASRNIAVENVKGVLLNNMRNVYDVTDSENSEHVRHSDGCLSHQDSMDVLFSGGKSSMLYSTTNIGSQSSNVKFSVSSKFSIDSEFIFNCKNVNNCFMCFGLRDKSYCVLNVEYSPEEYFALVDKIKSGMIERGEYGDGLGLEFSAQSYNFSLSQISFPLSDAEIIKFGGYVAKEPETNAGNVKILSPDEVPQTISETTDDIINYAIQCEVTRRPFRIIASELQFYRLMKLPLPAIHPSLRMQENLQITVTGRKYESTCAKCKKPIDSVFNPKDGFILYCEKCYQQEVY